MAPRKASLPFDGYVRVSRVGGRGGASFISPAVQRETVERLAVAHGVQLAGAPVEELDVSGGKPIEERELGRLIRRVEDGESGGLIVWKVSRFSRSLLDGVMVAERVRAAGGRIIGEDLDTAQPMGRAILGFLLGWAEEELDARREGWRQAQVRAASRGVHPTRTPVGYLRDADGRLVPDPAVAPALVDVFKMRARDASLQECADRLGEATGRGHSRSAMKQLIESPTYLGRIVIGDEIYEDGAHPAIVTERQWQLAQRKGARPRHDGSLRTQGVLAGLIRCAGCGHLLQVTGSGPPDARVASYTCRRKRASGVCPEPASATVAKVDAVVMPTLDSRASHVDLEAMLVELHDAQAAWDAASRELSAFLEAALISELGADVYAAEVARRREVVQTTAEGYRAALDAQERLAGAGDAIGETRELAQRLIESITLRKSTRGKWDDIEDRLEIVWKDAG
jgi:DNA invertase Pin-like site-specific DNA recombinase